MDVKSIRGNFRDDPQIKKLTRSPGYSELWESIASRPRRALGSVDDSEFETYFWSFILEALKGPEPIDKLTGTERKKIATNIAKASRMLATAWKNVASEDRVLPVEFQVTFDSLACDAAAHEWELLHGNYVGTDANEKEMHSAQSSIYIFLSSGLPRLFEDLAFAADCVAKSKPVLAMPNDKNALRLYFIRKLTDWFFREFGKVLRGETLKIASIYFDCSDIDEAALSRLAPNPRERYEAVQQFLESHPE